MQYVQLYLGEEDIANKTVRNKIWWLLIPELLVVYTINQEVNKPMIENAPSNYKQFSDFPIAENSPKDRKIFWKFIEENTDSA